MHNPTRGCAPHSKTQAEGEVGDLKGLTNMHLSTGVKKKLRKLNSQNRQNLRP